MSSSRVGVVGDAVRGDASSRAALPATSLADVRLALAQPAVADQVAHLDEVLHGRAAWTSQITSDEIRRGDSCWFAALLDDQLIGIAGGRVATGSFPRTAGSWKLRTARPRVYDAHLLLLLVDPEWAGRGIGRRLMAAFAQRVSGTVGPAMGEFVVVRIDVPVDAAAARGLYSSLGAEEVARIPDCDGFGRPAITLAWSLAERADEEYGKQTTGSDVAGSDVAGSDVAGSDGIRPDVESIDG